MRNLIPYSADSYQFFELVLSSKKTSKKDIDYKSRIDSLSDNIQSLYEKYDAAFDKDELNLLGAFGYEGTNRTDLQKLYRYNAKPFQALKNDVSKIHSDRINNTCQNCTINSIDSLDHFLPQQDYSEYTVHPKNLIPSCTSCNRTKNDIISNNGDNFFLNLYKDILPKSQFLFVETKIDSKLIETKFTIHNTSNIDSKLFKTIESHFTKLKLLKDFEKNNDSVISPLINSINSNLQYNSRADVISIIRNTCRENQAIFGFNFWKSILELALIDDQNFWKYYIKP